MSKLLHKNQMVVRADTGQGETPKKSLFYFGKRKPLALSVQNR